MNYNRTWLDGIKETRSLIAGTDKLIEKIPNPEDRSLVRRQFSVVVESFGHGLDLGLPISKEQLSIAQLGVLAAKLIDDSCAAYS